MDKKIIFSIVGNVLFAFSPLALFPIFYSLLHSFNIQIAIFFLSIGIFSAVFGVYLIRLGKNHTRKILIVESALSMVLAYFILGIFGAVPFLITGWLNPLDSLLESISDFTSAGISILPSQAPYIFRIWQSELMWFGSLIFLILLVTVMPEVSGCFGINLSLSGGQNFSPRFGQMRIMARYVIKIYVILTLISFIFFKLAGLGFFDSILMAMRCISTGGGDFFPAPKNIYVEYAAAFTMLLACGNFLLYHRFFYTIISIPPQKQDQNIFIHIGRCVKHFRRIFITSVKEIFTGSEIKFFMLIVFSATFLLFLHGYITGFFTDGNVALRQSFFHVCSFISTTGIYFIDFSAAPDFNIFLIFILALIGGCVGSVTGGLKIMRLLLLFKTTAREIIKTLHPHMVETISINKTTVEKKIIGRVLSFSFLSLITIFICAAILSLTDSKFSDSVAMSISCLTNVGTLPGICDPKDFLSLPSFGKIFCMFVLIAGRLEIFAVLILFAGIRYKHRSKKW